MIAATVSRIIKVYFRFRLKNEGVSNPTLVKKYTKTGNSKTIPEPRVVDTKVLIYELRVIVFFTASLT